MKSVEEQIAHAIESKWGDNGVKYSVGLISSLCTTKQLQALLDEVIRAGTYEIHI